MLIVHLFDSYAHVNLCHFFLPPSVGCDFCLWLFLDFSVYLFVTGNYNIKTSSMTGILEHLKWESLKKRRRASRLILLYNGLKGKASIPTNR